MKACIAIPSIREQHLRLFLGAWKSQFAGHDIVVVEDNPTRTFDLPPWVTHAAWSDIEKDLGDNAWIIPRRAGAIRNYAMLMAARRKPDMIVMLDDDCLPAGEAFLSKHWAALESPGTFHPLYDTMQASGTGIMARGYPKSLRRIKTVVNHGLWNNVPDLDGETQLKHPELRTAFPDHSVQVARGVFFPFSAMNVAFRPEVLAAMYQMPMGQEQPFERFDDIWCGWIMKKTLDAVGLSVRSGAPFVHHSRASDAVRNAEQEAPGIAENETVFRMVASMGVPTGSLDACLSRIHEQLTQLGDYWRRAGEAAAIWRRLAEEALA